MIEKLNKYEMDFTDAIFVEKIEEGYKNLEKQLEDRTDYEKMTNSQKIKHECGIVRTFIDYVLEDNASKDIFGESYSFIKHLEVLEYFNTKMAESTKQLQTRTAKYSPDRLKR